MARHGQPPVMGSAGRRVGLMIAPRSKIRSKDYPEILPFQAKWRPVRVKKTRQIKNLEPRFDSVETEKALAGGRDPSFESVGQFDIDLKRRYSLAPVHLDDYLVRIERDMPRYHGKNFVPQQHQQIRLPARAALMRQQNLQPFPCNWRGSRRWHSAAAPEEPQQTGAHAALRPSNRFIRPLRSTGTSMVMVSPIRRRAASV